MTITKNDMTAEEARWRWRYEPETGAMFHNRRETGKGIRKFGAPAGHLQLPGGYVILRVYRGGGIQRQYQAHRVAWLIVHGRWPEVEIDHVNGVTHDNRFVNLREATVAQNNCNTRAKSTHLKGAYPQEYGWFSVIVRDGHRQYLGFYYAEQEAHEAYKRAALTATHKEYARLA